MPSSPDVTAPTSGLSLWERLRADDRAPAYHRGTYRAARPAATLRRLWPLLPRAGVTRLADLTGLDTTGVPVFQAVRPNSRNISVSNGKGLTPDQARVSALVEALEGFHAEEIRLSTVRSSVAVMSRELDYDPFALAVVRRPAGCARRDFDYDPFLPPVGRPCLLTRRAVLDWIPATNLATGAASWVPRQLCELDFTVREQWSPPLFRATSNGLAGGNSLAEAVLHGLCEVIERDGVARAGAAWADPDRCIDPATVDAAEARRLLGRLARAGFSARVVDLHGPAGLPCFEAYLADREHAAYKGYGCHPSRATALVRALTEAAQSRASHVAGSRDDLYRETYRAAAHLPPLRRGSFMDTPARADFGRCPNLPVKRWNDVLTQVVRRVTAQTGMAPLAVDLSRPEFDLPVVFVVAPGLDLVAPQRR